VTYQFGPFRLEVRERRLWRGGEVVPLRGKVFDTLSVLVENAGRLVTKQELLDAVWPEATVEESNLNHNVSVLRKALGDEATAQQYIETVPRVGYRFASPVHGGDPDVRPMTSPRAMPPGASARQEVRYCTTSDGVRLGYATSGSGPPLVKVSNWLTHLDFEWDSPIWRHWWTALSAHHRLIRYDERGNGMSQRDVPDVSFDTMVHDLETVVDAAGLERFPLLGISRGGAIALAYAAKHPERVTQLVLYGAVAVGLRHVGSPQELEARRALRSLTRLGWGLNNPAFRRIFTSRFIPDATAEHERWFDELQRVSTSQENAARLMDLCDLIDIRPLLTRVAIPALVIHCDRDQAVPPEDGRLLAARIPAARYVSLPSSNHLILETEPAWPMLLEEVGRFLNWAQTPASSAATPLEVVAPLAETTTRAGGGKVCGVGFGDYHFDVEAGRLWRGTNELHLTPKASAVLSVLVTRAGQPVSKEELLASVWAGTIVSDDALTSCIQELRRALEDNAKQPRFIETRHRRGYLFVAPLSDGASSDAVTDAMPAASPDITSIAVLPFADMSPDRDQDYLCEGLADELINALTQVEGLQVAARMASFQFRAAGADVREIGRRLCVGTLLEGSVRKADNRLRVTVQLIEVASGYHRWSQRFDRTLDDVFAIEDEIAESVATSLRGSVAQLRDKPAQADPPSGVEAYEYYLRGRQYLPRMTEPDLAKSAELFERAIALDPDYGPAMACLGTVHATVYEWFGARAEDLIKADRMTERAMELAPALAEPHAARGFVLSLSGRYDEAARAFEEAIRLNPSLFDAYYYFGRSSFAAGDTERSVDLFRKAADVRREDFQSPFLLALSLRTIGRTREAEKAVREGIRRAERVLALNPVDARALSMGSVNLLLDGQRERAMEWSRRSLELYPDHMTTIVNAACLYSIAGDKERALEFLERLFARGWGKRDWVERDPDYGILRDDPRFKTLVARLK